MLNTVKIQVRGIPDGGTIASTEHYGGALPRITVMFSNAVVTYYLFRDEQGHYINGTWAEVRPVHRYARDPITDGNGHLLLTIEQRREYLESRDRIDKIRRSEPRGRQ